MATNILALASQALNSNAVGQIAGLLGEDQGATQAAADAGLPAIVGGLMKQADTSGGAQQIFDMASRADSGLLNNLDSAIGDGNHTSLIQSGMGILGSVFGASNAGLVSSLARSTGIGQGSAGSLLGMLAPLVMGAVKSVMTSDNLDAGGVANMLAAQKDYVAGTLPDQIRTDLALNDQIGQQANPGNTGASDASGEHPARKIPTDADEVTDITGGLLGKLLPIIVLGVLAWLGYRYLASGEVSPPVAPTEQRSTEQQPSEQPRSDTATN